MTNANHFKGSSKSFLRLHKKWKHATKDNDFTTFVQRTGFPMQPEKTCSLYSIQGSTATPGLIAHVELPRKVSPDIKYLIVYVLLSRVRRLAALVSIGLNDSIRAIIESGPPDDLVGSFNQLFDNKISQSTEVAAAALEKLFIH